MEISKQKLEGMIKEILMQKLGECSDRCYHKSASGVIGVKTKEIKVESKDRLDTGNSKDIVYTKDLFTLEESKRLGCGIMEMEHTTFDWTLTYDEIDYVIKGSLSILINGEKITANEGELIFIPNGSKIKFSVEDSARFLYVTYPADWANS